MSASDEISSYLLGELDPDAAASFERRMAGDAALREEVEGLRPVVERLSELPDEVWEGPEPPPLELPGNAGAAPAPRRRWRLPTLTLRPVAAVAASVLLLAVGAGIGALVAGGGSGDGPPVEESLSLSRVDDGPSGAHGSVLVSAGRTRAEVDVSGLDPSGAGRFYELWLLDEDGKTFALGSFRVAADGSADVEIPIPVQPSRYRYFDVSLQEDDGDPAHSGISVLRGPASS